MAAIECLGKGKEDPDGETITSKLNIDCLSLIISYLDLNSLVNASQVCKRWKWVCKLYLKPRKVVDFTEKCFDSLILPKCHDVRQFLRLCTSVTEIIVSVDKGGEIIEAIADSCSQLERLAVRHDCRWRCWADNEVILTKYFANLKSFKVRVTGQWRCNLSIVDKVIGRTPRLEELSVEGDVRGRGRWLRTLTLPLKVLNLRMDFHYRHLLTFLKHYGEHLLLLSINPHWSRIGFSAEKISAIFSLTPNVTEINIEGFDFDLRPDGNFANDEHVIALKHLTTAHIQCARLTNEYLVVKLSEGCPNLTHLNFAEIGYNPWDAKRRPCHPDNLFLYNLLGAPTFREGTLRSIPPPLWERLREMTMWLVHMTEESCCLILRNAIVLERLDLSYNPGVTNVTFDCACDVLRRDPLRPNLNLKLIGCRNVTKRENDVDPAVARRISFDFIDPDLPPSVSDDFNTVESHPIRERRLDSSEQNSNWRVMHAGRDIFLMKRVSLIGQPMGT